MEYLISGGGEKLTVIDLLKKLFLGIALSLLICLLVVW